MVEHLVIMTPRMITKTINRAMTLLLGSTTSTIITHKKVRKRMTNSYAAHVMNSANSDVGMICRKCYDFIRPGETCYSHVPNNDYTICAYYHVSCHSRMYQ